MRRQTDEIVIVYVYPPIPDRRFDWNATWSNDEPNDNGCWGGPQGYGRTPLDAIRELLDETEANEDDQAEQEAAQGAT
jgi:hypothetical protein